MDSVLPFHQGISRSFQSLIKNLAPHVTIKSYKFYATKSDQLFQSLVYDLKANFRKVDYVCLTVDHWASYRKGYIGFTAHWYNGKLMRKHACLALRRIIGSCAFNALAKTIESAIVEFKLSGKVTHCITDSGSNFLKAFDEFASTFNEEMSVCSNDVARESGEVENIHAASISDYMICEQEDEKEFDLLAHVKCAAHKISLIATKDSFSALSNGKYRKVYRGLMAKLSAIWHPQSKSVLASDKIRKALGKSFVTPNSTRWNSPFDALVGVNEFLSNKKHELVTLFINFDLRPINGAEQTFPEEFLGVMKPLAAGLDILQGENDVSAGYLLPTIINIQEEWRSLSQSDLVYCNCLIESMHSGLCRRFDGEMQSSYFKVAAAVHLMFRLNWVSENDKGEIVSLVYKALSPFEKDQRSVVEDYTSEKSATNSFFGVLKKEQNLITT